MIELLVVIAIISILASMLLPTLAKAKKASHGVVCKNNVRQITLSALLYADGYRFPEAYYPTDSVPPLLYWPHLLEPYTQSKWEGQLYLCPDFGNAPCLKWNHPTYDHPSNPYLPAERVGSYGFNAWGVAPTIPYLGLDDLREDLLAKPDQTYAFGDFLENWGKMGLGPPWGLLMRFRKVIGDVNYEQNVALTNFMMYRHNGKLNIGFGDGHLQEMPWKIPTTSIDDDIFRHWNWDNQPHGDALKNVQ